MFTIPNFSMFFCKSDVTSPVAPKRICIISNEKLGTTVSIQMTAACNYHASC